MCEHYTTDSMQETVQKKRRYIRNMSSRATDPSYEQTFNSYNCEWLHKHFRPLLGHLMRAHPVAAPFNVIGDMLV